MLEWSDELQALGYSDPLPRPIPAIEATLAAMDGSEVHQFIQTHDRNALSEAETDGEHPPLFLTTLDLSHWTLIVNTSSLDVKKALARLRDAVETLGNILVQDVEDFEKAAKDERQVEIALKRANPQEGWSAVIASSPLTAEIEVPPIHPLFMRLNIPEAQKAALEDLS